MIVFTETEPDITIHELREVENYAGLVFPKEYINHLLKHNGGRCYPNTFNFVEDGEVTSSSVEWFLAVYDGKYDNLRRDIEIYKLEEKRMPSQILPIANDGLGNCVCISCGEEDYGFVYFWDHEKEVNYEESDDTDYSNLYLIAKSFNEFIDGLYEDNE